MTATMSVFAFETSLADCECTAVTANRINRKTIAFFILRIIAGCGQGSAAGIDRSDCAPSNRLLARIVRPFLPLGQLDTHFLERHLIQSAGRFDAVSFLVFFQALTGWIIELAGLFAGIHASALETPLSFDDLILCRTE